MDCKQESSMTTTDEREQMLGALETFIKSRSGLDYNNYNDAASYRAEQRSITKDRNHALTLLRQVELRPSIDAAALKDAFRAFSGRLSWDGKRLDYCTGQYYPTEYRRAACAVLASALWEHARANMPEPVYTQHGSATDLPISTDSTYDGLSAGSWLRRHFRRQFGRGIASRWFS
jgi:hypothetical protein